MSTAKKVPTPKAAPKPVRIALSASQRTYFANLIAQRDAISRDISTAANAIAIGAASMDGKMDWKIGVTVDALILTPPGS